MNPENPDSKKISSCDWVFVDGLGVKFNTILSILSRTVDLLTEKAHVVVMAVDGINEAPEGEVLKVLRKQANGDVKVRNKMLMQAGLKDTTYLPTPIPKNALTLLHFELCPA